MRVGRPRMPRSKPARPSARSSRGRRAARSRGRAPRAAGPARPSGSSATADGTAATMSKPVELLARLLAPLADGRHHDVADVVRVAEPQDHAVGDLARQPEHAGGQAGEVDRQVGARLVAHEVEAGAELLARAAGPRRGRSRARSPTYSRISRSGLSIVWPYQPSTTGRCETPSPATARPPENSSSVANDCAVLHRRARVDRHHAGAEPDALGARGVGHQERDRVARRDVGHVDRLVAELLGALRRAGSPSRASVLRR